MSLSGSIIYENDNPNLIDYVKMVEKSQKICLYCHTNNSHWTKYELVCGHQMHSRCARKWFAEQGGILHCPSWGELKEEICNMCCRDCKKFGHYLEKCPNYFKAMANEQLDTDILAMIKYKDIQEKWHDGTLNRSCIFCNKWSLGDNGTSRFFSIHGGFLLPGEESKKIMVEYLNSNDEIVEVEESEYYVTV